MAQRDAQILDQCGEVHIGELRRAGDDASWRQRSSTEVEEEAREEHGGEAVVTVTERSHNMLDL